MSRRSTLLVASVLSTVVMTTLPPAARADTRVPVLGALPLGMTAVQTACDGQGDPTGTLEPAVRSGLVAGPEQAPLHDDSLQISSAADRTPGLALDLATSADLAGLRIAAYRATRPRLSVRTADGTWLPSASLVFEPGGLGWRWLVPQSPTDPDLGAVTAVLTFGRCTPSAGELVHLDGLTVGQAGEVTTYDFEDGRVDLTALGAGGLVGQRQRWISCRLGEAALGPTAGAIAGQDLVFETREPGQEFRRIGTARTTEHGQATLRLKPARTFDYRCTFAGTDGTSGPPWEAATSRPVRVAVGAHVAIRARRVADSRRVRVTGRVDPARPGTKVVLHARDGFDGRVRRLGRTTVTGTGAYRFDRRLAPPRNGLWTLWVTTPAVPDAGLGRGESAWRSLE